jgi:hypothetical protein
VLLINTHAIDFKCKKNEAKRSLPLKNAFRQFKEAFSMLRLERLSKTIASRTIVQLLINYNKEVRWKLLPKRTSYYEGIAFSKTIVCGFYINYIIKVTQ